METLFRFNMIRKTHRAADELVRIDLTTDSEFQRRVAATTSSGDRWLQQVKNVADTFVNTSSFVKRRSDLLMFKEFGDLAKEIDTLIASAEQSPEILWPVELGNIITQNISSSISEWLAREELREHETNIKDSILAIKFLPKLHYLEINVLADYLRLLSILKSVEKDNDFPLNLDQLKQYRRQNLLLPEAFKPPTQDRRTSPQTPSKVEGKLRKLADSYRQLTQAIDELHKVKASAFENTPVEAKAERLPPEKFRPKALFESEFLIRQSRLSQILNNDIPSNVSSSLEDFALQNLAKEGANFKMSNSAALSLRGLPSFDPKTFKKNMVLSPQGLESISKETRSILWDYKLDTQDTVSTNISCLIKEKQQIASEARQLLQPFGQTSYHNLGNIRLVKKNMPVSGFFSLSPTLLLELFPRFRDVTGSVPLTRSDLKPAGELELLVVKQQLLNYSTADIAAIRNIMNGESNEQIKRSLSTRELEFYRETESTREEETSTEVSERFEMKREVEETLKEELSAKGSLTVSGKLGPQFEYRVHGEIGWQKSVESTTKAATEMAREVTEKASEKVTERVLSRQRTLIRNEEELTLTQKLSNESGEHITGIYQWLNKIYEAQVYNYGLREVYDLMIPEPGAMLMALFNRREATALDIEQVPPLNIQPKDLEPDNYQEYVRLYHVTDVSPPPEPFVTVTHNFSSGGGDDSNQRYTHSAKLSIPNGYQAFRASVGAVTMVWDDWAVDVIIGQRFYRFEGAGVFFTDLNEETESIPIGVVSIRVADMAIVVEVVCRATDRAMDLWRIDTYNKLVNAYRLKKSEQDAILADRMAEVEFTVPGVSEGMNEKMIREELKRLCISMLTEQHFDHFKAITVGFENLPELDFDEALSEGAYVRFFEQAFEWENISWITYPYFWGQKSQWENKVLLEGVDSDYLDFLKAGYVRVVLPVREGFGSALDHFRLTGEPWLGGALPTVSDELYLPIADEIAERLDRPGKETPFGEPWPVVVPTRLIKLRRDDSLPQWSKDASGVWTEN